MIKIVKYDEGFESEWDDLIRRSSNPNLLMLRNYMDYHKERFRDHSILFYKEQELIGVFPAASNLENKNEIISHPGLTYGGLILRMDLSQDQTQNLLDVIVAYYRSLGFSRIIYKLKPNIYSIRPSEQDEYFLWRNGFECFRIDLSVSIDLYKTTVWSSRRIRAIKKARSGIEISNDIKYLEEFWNILAQNLLQKHSASPTHSISEIKSLISLFPNSIIPTFALRDGKCLGGVITYQSTNVHHSQYISASREGNTAGALELIFEKCINDAKLAQARYYDFGISTTNFGHDLNEGLYNFKTEFGGGGTCHKFYKLDL